MSMHEELSGSEQIEMSVVQQRLLTVADDVGHILIRGAFSSNIKERRDCSTAVFGATGNLVAQADHMPIHIGSLLWGVRALLNRYGSDGFEDGEAFVMNDPYLAGGTHLPDISIITPVFIDRKNCFFVGNIAHHADVGGPTPGSVSGNSPTIFHEGIRIPPIRIARKGHVDHDVINLITQNTRNPIEGALDLQNQIGANERGCVLLNEVVQDHGLQNIQRAETSIIKYTKRRIQNEVNKLPNGEFTATRFLDDDGRASEPVALKVKAIIDGVHLTFDFTGSGNQAGGAVNLSNSSLEATVAYAVKSLLAPDVPGNSGLFESINTILPEKSIVNPISPAAVAARAVTSNRLAGAIFDAIGQALPKEKRMGSSNDSTSLIVLAGFNPETRESFVYPESIGGGAGARFLADGMDAVHVHTVNSTNLPIEVLELEYPLRCNEYSLVVDSGGPGRTRGGLGIAREICAVDVECSLTIRSDGHLFSAPGTDGGKSGSTTKIFHKCKNKNLTELRSKSTLTLKPGESVRVETLGGGGLGPPEQRNSKSIKQDLADGKITAETAKINYNI